MCLVMCTYVFCFLNQASEFLTFSISQPIAITHIVNPISMLKCRERTIKIRSVEVGKHFTLSFYNDFQYIYSAFSEFPTFTELLVFSKIFRSKLATRTM